MIVREKVMFSVNWCRLGLANASVGACWACPITDEPLCTRPSAVAARVHLNCNKCTGRDGKIEK